MLSKMIVLVALAAQTNAISLEKISALINNDVNAPGQDMPTGYTECSGSFEIISNCGQGLYASCDGANSGIFDQSWAFPGEAGATASGYLLCEWIGGANDGVCQPRTSGAAGDFCYKRIIPSPAPSSSRAASSSTAASASSSSGPSASMSDPLAICHAKVTEGYNIGVQMLTDIPSATIVVGSSYSIDLSAYFCDPESQAITYSVEGNIPAGLSVSGSVLSGVVQTTGHFQLQAFAVDVDTNPPSPNAHWWLDVEEAM